MMIHRFLRKLSREQKVAIVLARPISATLSLISSSIIIYKIFLRYRAQSKTTVGTGSFRSSSNDGITTYHRMLLIISIMDFFHSLSSAVSTLAVPAYTNGTFAIGTTATCVVQATLHQMTPSIVLYMAMLNIYFMLKIRYNISESVIKRRYEIWLHAIPIGHYICSAIVGLSMGIFGPISLPELGCWLDSFCAVTNTCTRSGPIFYNHVGYFAWMFAYIWLFICIIIVFVNGVLIYTAIRRQEKRNENYFAARLQKEGPTLASGSLSDFNRSSTSIQNLRGAAEIMKEKENQSQPPLELEQSGNAEETDLSTSQKKREWEEEAIYESVMFPAPPPPTTKNDDIVSVASITNKQTTKTTIKQSRIAAVQSALYVSSAIFTAIWIFMPWLGYKLQVGSRARFFFAFMVNFASPSQGMFNLFIFVRLHYLRLRESNKDWSRWKCVKECLFSSD